MLGIGSPRLPELAYRMLLEERRRSELEIEVAVLRHRLAAATEEAGRGQRGLRALSVELENLRAFAGLTPIQGPGVLVELSDNPRPLRPGDDPNEGLLHYSDLVRIVTDLWGAGAEAVAINGERLMGTSAITCVGTTVLVNQRRLTPPFRLTAIGDARHLAAALVARGGTLDMLKAFGFPVRVVQVTNVKVPPFRGALEANASRSRPSRQAPAPLRIP